MNADKQDTLEDIFNKQDKKLHQLDVATVLIKAKQSVKSDLQKIYNEVQKISYGIEDIRKDLEIMKEQNVRLKELASLTDVLSKKIINQEENVPPELIQGYLNAKKQTYSQTSISSNMLECTINSTHKLTGKKTPRTGCINIEKQEMIKNCKRTLFNEPEICPTMLSITVEEFSKVPKYMIGRQSLETINTLINALNQTLLAKYTILSLGKAAAQKKGEINLYLHYRKQEFDVQDENGYLYFFTAEDYYRQTKTKLDKTKLNLITVLRHCKRLRECRIKNDLRYVIIQR
ncbi:spindle and kinetochore-associated protein 1 [Harpegnathos saltator]|uniref:SKA complex subunit 1 n=1 Tax=Harpegnathos saltator TaxID=610380 RepID=E2B342_HARSA|nr:spindle and kinetochore-associated protein 1 [Harpegnathos saltator]EFN89891.1 Spindle and kinetochore-associated protein 1 [Harpegnathos saltator]